MSSLGFRSAGVAALGAHNDSELRGSAGLEGASSHGRNEAQGRGSATPWVEAGTGEPRLREPVRVGGLEPAGSV